MQETMSGPRRRSESLDVVRGIAVTLVVVSHYWPSMTKVGIIGVDLFFVLSGYLIGGILVGNRGKAGYFQTFYARRFFRIQPLYFILLMVCLLAGALDQPLWHYLLFIQNVGYAENGYAPHNGWPVILVPTWSLAIEEQFYLLLPLLVWATRLERLPRVLWILVFGAPVARAFFPSAVSMTPYAALLAILECLDSLIGGVLLAYYMWLPQNARRKKDWLVRGLAFIAFSGGVSWLAHSSDPFASAFITAMFTALLVLALRIPARVPLLLQPLRFMGLGAYSIYLLHLPVLSVVSQRAPALAVTGLLSFLVYSYIERPITDWARDRWRYSALPRGSGHLARSIPPEATIISASTG
jgi:peptidoglycan/LPS O-acetylase OafA/YrhL